MSCRLAITASERERGHRPLRRLRRQRQDAEKIGQVVGQRVQLHRVGGEAATGHPRPSDRVLSLFDVLLGGATKASASNNRTHHRNSGSATERNASVSKFFQRPAKFNSGYSFDVSLAAERIPPLSCFSCSVAAANCPFRNSV